MGREPEYTLTGLKDPVAALQTLKKHGLEGARIENGNLVFVDLKKDLGGKVRSASKELGATLSKKRGYAKLIGVEHYDRILRMNERQQNLLNRPPAVDPLFLAGAATAYAAKPRADRRDFKGKTVGRGSPVR